MPLYGTAKAMRLASSGSSEEEPMLVETTRPLSALVAGLITANDAAVINGWGHSPSNRQINGIIKGGTAWQAGQTSPADSLRAGGINCLIREQGFRLWGDNITHDEPVFRDLKRLRIFDKLAKAALTQLFLGGWSQRAWCFALSWTIDSGFF